MVDSPKLSEMSSGLIKLNCYKHPWFCERYVGKHFCAKTLLTRECTACLDVPIHIFNHCYMFSILVV